jgi:putative flippase GtrA
MPERFLRFLVVGVVSTAFSYGVYALLLFAGLHYAAANLGALVAAVPFGFKLQGRFVFDSTDNRLLGRFACAWVCIYAVNVLFIRQMIHAGFGGYMAGALAIPAIATLSYGVQRFFVFRRRQTVQI